jgi:environmental stress-induced protein Ves
VIRILRARDHVARPWKNGGGVTREIAAHPAGAGLDTFDWRVSMATVEVGGPFSLFAGVDRSLTVLEGRLTLTIEGRGAMTMDEESQPIAFPGDVGVDAATPSEPVTDLQANIGRVDRDGVTPHEVQDGRRPGPVATDAAQPEDRPRVAPAMPPPAP